MGVAALVLVIAARAGARGPTERTVFGGCCDTVGGTIGGTGSNEQHDCRRGKSLYLPLPPESPLS